MAQIETTDETLTRLGSVDVFAGDRSAKMFKEKTVVPVSSSKGRRQTNVIWNAQSPLRPEPSGLVIYSRRVE